MNQLLIVKLESWLQRYERMPRYSCVGLLGEVEKVRRKNKTTLGTKERTDKYAHTPTHTHTSVVTLLCIPLFWWIKFSSINKQNNLKVVTLFAVN